VLRPGTFALTALLAALTAVGPLSTDMYLPSLPTIADQLHASTAQAELTISSYLVGFAVGQLIYGPFSDRYGRKPVLLAALLLYSAASFISAFSPTIEMLIAARALQAIGGCGAIVLARAVVRDLYSGARAGRELSLMGLVMALAPVIAPLIGGALQTTFGWQANFVVLVLCGLVLAGVVSWLLPETLDPALRRAASPLEMLRSYRIFLSDGGYLAHTGIVMFTYAGLFAWIAGASFVLQDIYGLSSFAFGGAFAVGSAGVMVGSAFATRMSGRLSFDALIGIGVAAQVLGGLAMIADVAFGGHSAFGLVVPMAVYLAGLGIVLPQAIAAAMHSYPDRAGAASSLIGFLQQTAAALCGVAVGHLLHRTPWPMVLGIAITAVIALGLWALTRESRHRALH
jgi:DHA1 family bicyclomycin/chloramphenicol resistance-like MFS transporter